MFFKRDVLLAQEYLAFMLLNLFDLFLTGWIFRHNGSEANGIAVFFLKHGGLSGFVMYKFCLVVIVVLACEGISVQSIRKSRIVITAGCLVYLFIVFWECFLILTYINGPQRPEGEDDGSTADTLVVTPPPHVASMSKRFQYNPTTNVLTIKRAQSETH